MFISPIGIDPETVLNITPAEKDFLLMNYDGGWVLDYSSYKYTVFLNIPHIPL